MAIKSEYEKVLARKAVLMLFNDLIDIGAYEAFRRKMCARCGPLFPPERDDMVESIISALSISRNKHRQIKTLEYYVFAYSLLSTESLFAWSDYVEKNFWGGVCDILYRNYVNPQKNKVLGKFGRCIQENRKRRCIIG